MGVKSIRILASIVIPCSNQLEFTRQCIAALTRFTHAPWELIAVNNGSTDGTNDYLAGVQDASPVPTTVIANASNLGFPAAVNQGLQIASGRYLVLLNNDVVVTDGWLEQLIALADAKRAPTTEDSLHAANADLRIGLVGPMSNYASPPQLVAEVPYRDMNAMHAFARRWRDDHRGQWFTTPKLSGFCLLMKRAVYDTIGGLDERFGLGFFDDDDLAERARRAGFGCAVAHDLFVHHFGSRTFAGNGVDAEKLLNQNARRFADKWGLPRTNGRRVALQPFMSGPSHSDDANGSENTNISPSLRSAARVSLTMIVKNEQENLPHCLKSAAGLFDEIVVVDTGSTDRTREIAAEFGARVFEFPWIDDFSAARNAALERATGDYAFWLDADDVIDSDERQKMAALFERLSDAQQIAYVVRCACDPSPDGVGGETVVDHVRLFPLRSDIRWTYRVHEQIMPALRRGAIPVRWSDCVVRHTGYTDVALRARKLERDARILRQELDDRPDDPFVLFNLGSIATEQRDWRGALDFLKRSLSRSAPTDSITCKLFALIARSHQMLGDSMSALRTCDQGLKYEPADAELWFRKGVVHRQRGEPAEAEICWRRILTLKPPQQFRSVDLGIYGHLTRRNLAALAAERGDDEEAGRLWNRILLECPGDRETIEKLRKLEPCENMSAADRFAAP